MIKLSSFVKPIFLVALPLLVMSGCKKDKEENTDPNVIPSTSIRIRATINAPGVQPNDVYRVAGLFARPNQWSNLANSYIMGKDADGTYSITIASESMLGDPEPKFFFRISRNGQFEERTANCEGAVHEIWKTHYLGKEFKITVDAFQGTGSCPP
jgi:hypothetical protein